MNKSLELFETIERNGRERKYQEDRILSGELVQTILEAGLRALPHREVYSPQFIIIEEEKTRIALSYMCAQSCDFLRSVSLGIVILGSPLESEYWMVDASQAATCIQLQAKYLGLSTSWADVYGQFTLNGQDSSEYVRNLLNIPYQLEVLCILGIGISSEEYATLSTEDLNWEKLHLGSYQSSEL